MLAQSDPEQAKRAIAEIEDESQRRGAILMLVQAAPSDDAAIALGRDYDLDRERVLQIHSQGFAFGRFAPPPSLGTTMARPLLLDAAGDAVFIENR